MAISTSVAGTRIPAYIRVHFSTQIAIPNYEYDYLQ